MLWHVITPNASLLERSCCETLSVNSSLHNTDNCPSQCATDTATDKKCLILPVFQRKTSDFFCQKNCTVCVSFSSLAIRSTTLAWKPMGFHSSVHFYEYFVHIFKFRCLENTLECNTLEFKNVRFWNYWMPAYLMQTQIQDEKCFTYTQLPNFNIVIISSLKMMLNNFSLLDVYIQPTFTTSQTY